MGNKYLFIPKSQPGLTLFNLSSLQSVNHKFCVVQKRRLTDFEAVKLSNIWMVTQNSLFLFCLPEQVRADASNDRAGNGRDDPAGEGDVVLPQVHGDVLLVQRLLGRSPGAQQGGAVVSHRAATERTRSLIGSSSFRRIKISESCQCKKTIAVNHFSF